MNTWLKNGMESLVQCRIQWRGETKLRAYKSSPHAWISAIRQRVNDRVVPDVHKRGVWWVWKKLSCGTFQHVATIYSLNADDL